MTPTLRKIHAWLHDNGHISPSMGALVVRHGDEFVVTTHEVDPNQPLVEQPSLTQIRMVAKFKFSATGEPLPQ